MITRFPSLPPTTALLLLASASAQEWYLEPQTSAPPARRFHALAHVGGSQLLFGGVDEQSGTVHGDTWRYDGIAWFPLASTGPGPRQRFAACVDTTHDRLLVFGGSDANGQPRNDTWQFAGGVWQQLPLAASPSARLGAAMAFDRQRQRAVLFGGGATAAAPTGETWEFDGTQWLQQAPANAPTARQGHAMTFDTQRGVTMLFGGRPAGSTAFDATTWQWDGTTWTPVVTATTPPAMAFPSLAFFEPHGVAVLTGSSGAASQPLGTWVFDGTDWSSGPTSPAGFGGRQGHATVYDPLREMVVLFGGARIAIGGAIPLADTWELSTQATFAAFGAGCGGAAAPVLRARDASRPQLGSSLQLEVSPVTAEALFVAGHSDTTFLGAALPLELSFVGLPGCELRTSIEFTALAPGVDGAATAAIPVPRHRALLGQQFFVQALVLDPAASVPGAMSNGGRATIGN